MVLLITLWDRRRSCLAVSTKELGVWTIVELPSELIPPIAETLRVEPALYQHP